MDQLNKQNCYNTFEHKYVFSKNRRMFSCTDLHGKHPAGRLSQSMFHCHLQPLQVMMLDNKSQNRPLEVPLSFAEGSVSGDQPGKLWRWMPQEGGAYFYVKSRLVSFLKCSCTFVCVICHNVVMKDHLHHHSEPCVWGQL